MAYGRQNRTDGRVVVELKRGRGSLALGADQVVIAGGEDLQESILELTGVLGTAAIYDPVGGPGLEELIWATKPTKRPGQAILYGQLGAIDQETPLSLGTCCLRGLKLHASFRVFDFTGYSRLGLLVKTKAVERAKKCTSDGLTRGFSPPKIDRIFLGLDQNVAAHRYMEMNSQIGKIIFFERLKRLSVLKDKVPGERIDFVRVS